LGTLKFKTRRASYYWWLDALSLYQPYVWEYSRLNITNTVMSKNKALKVRYDQAQEHATNQNGVGPLETRRCVDERALEKEEEDYFNERYPIHYTSLA
ncbi:glutamine--tRNA ligase-like protein, partial [Tanacetum coccineum]